MAHLQLIENLDGDLIDVVEFCSDFCHSDAAGVEYQGWNGCNELEFNSPCQNCGTTIEGVEGEYHE